MKHNARRNDRIRSYVTRTGVVLATTAAGVVLLAPASAMAASDPISVAASSSGYVPTGTTDTPAVNPGAAFTILYTIKNNESSGTLYNVGFTDTLPTGFTVDNPSNFTATGCGTVADSTTSGSGDVTIAGLEVTSGTSCTVSVSVDIASSALTATQPVKDSIATPEFSTTSTGTPSTTGEAATDASDTSIDVVGDPTIAVTGVTNNAKFSFGQLVALGYTATAASGDALASPAIAQDDQYDTLNDGDDLDTLLPGKHFVEIVVNTADGAAVTDQFDYTVAAPKLSAVKASGKTVSYAFKSPLKGKLKSELLDGKKIVGTATATVSKAGLATYKVSLDKKLAARTKLTVESTFTPSAKGIAAWSASAANDGFTGEAVTTKAKVTVS